jgi:ubiquitin-like modifier-activating enzyme ATG7
MKEYEEKGFDMLLKAFNENGYLEKLTGLDKLHEEGEAAIGDFDWDEGEVEED